MTFETFDQSDEGTLKDPQKTMTKTITKTKTMTKTNTFREHLQRATLESCNLWDIWSEWCGGMTWPTNIHWQRQIQLENTFKEQSWRLVTFETSDGVMRRHDMANKKTNPTYPNSPNSPNSTNSIKSPQLTQLTQLTRKTKSDPPDLLQLWTFWQLYWLQYIPHDIW